MRKMSIPDIRGAGLHGELGAEFIAASPGDGGGGEATMEEATRTCHDAALDPGPHTVVDDRSTGSPTWSVASAGGGAIVGHGDVGVPGDAAVAEQRGHQISHPPAAWGRPRCQHLAPARMKMERQPRSQEAPRSQAWVAVASTSRQALLHWLPHATVVGMGRQAPMPGRRPAAAGMKPPGEGAA